MAQKRQTGQHEPRPDLTCSCDPHYAYASERGVKQHARRQNAKLKRNTGEGSRVEGLRELLRW